MLQTKEIITAAGTLACAVGIGFIMQNGDTAKERYSGAANSSAGAAITVPAGDDLVDAGVDSVLEVQDITLTSAATDVLPVIFSPETSVDRVAAPESTLVTPEPDLSMNPQPCAISAQATASAGAMIDVKLTAACMPNEYVTVQHNGLMFTQATARDGSLTTSIPALAETAVVTFVFSNGEGTVVSTQVPDLDQYSRTAIQWKGDTGFGIHAREFGAEYGQDGHVWVGATREVGAIEQSRGFLTRLGNAGIAAPLMAEVYTYPLASGTQKGTIDLSVEAEVTVMNCGLEIEAQSIELIGKEIKTQDLTLAVPDCGAKGSFLVLNNLVQDITVASN